MNMIPQEISMIVSSDSANGALHKSADGSYFEINFDDPLMIPKDAKNITLSVQESTVWWVIPNITSSNNKLYIVGQEKASTKTRTELDFPTTTWNITGNILTMTSLSAMPTRFAGFVIDDVFMPTQGIEDNTKFVITAVLTDTTISKTYTLSNSPQSGNVLNSTDEWVRIRDIGISQTPL